MANVRYRFDPSGKVEEIHKIVVHRFRMGDVDDPEIYAAQPIYDWQQTDAGKFVMTNAVEQPEWHRQINHMNYGYEYAIIAELEAKKLTEFYLKWGKPE
jgi:hypothetical protein